MEVIIDGIVYVPKEIKTEVDILKENYNSGNYVLVRNTLNSKKYFIDKNFYYQSGVNVKLIHKKHKEILNAWLKDNSIDIEYEFDEETYNNAGWYDVTSFIEEYKEHRNYRLKQQYPIFKRSVNGIFKQTSEYDCEWVFHKNSYAVGNQFREYTGSDIVETILYDKQRGLYHLQPVWCWDSGHKSKVTMFYDVELKMAIGFSVEKGNEYHWDYIEPITHEQLKVMPFIWDMYQQVLKDNK